MGRSLRSRALLVLILFGVMTVLGLAARGEVVAASPAAEAAKAGREAGAADAKATKGVRGAGEVDAKGEREAGEADAKGDAAAKGDDEGEKAGDEEEAAAKEVKTHQTVHVGAYLNDVQTIDLKQHSYAVDLYIWFRWHSPDYPDFDPASSFEFTNANESWGHVREANWEAPRTLADGWRYQVVHAQGKFSRKFLLYNYPFDRQTIEVAFEDSVLDSKLLTYVADPEGFTTNPTMVLPGYRSAAPELAIADRQYPTRFGDPDRSEPESYSRVTLRLPIQRPRDTYMIKLMLPVLCVIACASLMFLIRPTYVDARMTIGITALLTIVALQITLNADLPDVDYLVLMDKVYIGAYLFVIAGLLVAVRTTRMIADEAQIPRAIEIDRKAMVSLLVLWTVATTAQVLLAMSRG